MKQLYLFTLRFVIPIMCLLFAAPALAQFRSSSIVWVSQPLNADGAVDGYYESLPAAYKSTTATYPLLVYLHGDESVEGTYKNILDNGVPALISTGAFPETFRVRGSTHSFIVIAPHFTIKNLSAAALGEAIDAILKKYRVDRSRVYLTGMSRGSEYTWEYAGASIENATRLAAIVPVSNALHTPDKEKAAIIGKADLPVWATHNQEDNLVPASYTENYVAWVNEQKPQPRAELWLIPEAGHEGWTRTYDPESKKFEGKNIYEWILQYTRGEETPLPVTLTSYKVVQSAPAEVTLSWSSAEAAEGFFTIERSATQEAFTKLATVPAAAQNIFTYVDKVPLPGVNYYRLSQTDPDGSITYFPVLKVSLNTSGRPAVALHPNPVSEQVVLQLFHNETGPVAVSVFNAAGALVRQWMVQKGAVYVQQSVSFTGLPRGSYVLQAQGKTFRHVVPFFKN